MMPARAAAVDMIDPGTEVAQIVQCGAASTSASISSVTVGTNTSQSATRP